MKSYMNFSYNIDKELKDKILNEDVLNEKEKRFFKYFMQNKTLDEIAKETNYSQRTISYKKKEIYMKIEKNYFNNMKILKKNYYKVYVLLFPNKKVYIGSSGNLKNRWRNGEGYSNQPKIYSAIQEFGWENIKKYIIYSNLTIQEAERKENETIVLYKSYMEDYGYNDKIID